MEKCEDCGHPLGEECRGLWIPKYDADYYEPEPEEREEC